MLVGTEVRSIQPDRLRGTSALDPLLNCPEVSRRVPADATTEVRAIAASEALMTFVRERVPALGGDWRDRLALEAALAVGIWEGQQVEDRIDRLERSTPGLSRDAFKRRRKKVLGWLAAWLMNEDDAPRVDVQPHDRRNRPVPLTELAVADAEQLTSECEELQRRALSALFATAGGLVLTRTHAEHSARLRVSARPVAPWDYYFAHEYVRLTSTATVLLLDRLGFEHPRIDLGRLRELVPTAHVLELEAAFAEVIEHGPLHQDAAVDLARAEYQSSRLPGPPGRAEHWIVFDHVQEWSTRQVILEDEPALRLLAHALTRLAEALNVISGPGRFIQRAIDNCAVHVRGTIAASYGPTDLASVADMEAAIGDMFNTLTEGRLRNAISLSGLDHDTSYRIEFPERAI